MKLTAQIPSGVRLEEVCAAMRSLGLELRYRDGELFAGRNEQHDNVVRLPRYRWDGKNMIPKDWPGKPAA